MSFAFEEYGVSERRGELSNSRIEDYLAIVGMGRSKDDVAWCSAFVNWCLGSAGVQGTGDPAARSFEKVIERKKQFSDELWPAQCLDTPSYGCVALLSRGGNRSLGHVGFYVGPEHDRILLLGGNQDNRVQIKDYARDRVVGYYLPAGFNPVEL